MLGVSLRILCIWCHWCSLLCHGEGTQGQESSRRKLLLLFYGTWLIRDGDGAISRGVLALLPLLDFGDGVVFPFSSSKPSIYAFTISGSISTSLTHESSISEYPSQ